MKKITPLLIAFFIFFGCGKQSEKVNESTKQKPDSTTFSEQVVTKRDTIEGAKIRGNKTSEVKILEFDKNSIPPECNYKGDVIEGAKWTDRNGENLLIISRTKPRVIKEDDREQYIYAYTYTRSDDKYSLLWSINDHVESPCDLDADYISGTLEVKDIDDDGIAENMFIYKLEGRCDVSPLPVKLMMHSGSTKLVIRGTTREKVSETEWVGGDKNIDAAFNSTPASFKKYASDKWDAFMKNYKSF